MVPSNKVLGIGVLIAIVLAIGGYFFPQAQKAFGDISTCNGSTSCFTNLYASGQLQVSPTGTTLNGINQGSCTIWTNSHTIAATSSKQIVCQSATNGKMAALTPLVPAGANCDLQMASSTSVKLGGLLISGVSASSTAGYIVANLTNLTGTTFTWSATASSSAKWGYMCFN